jgi:menaquinol-cytochrome c reductase iron-sulfur subunit
MFFDPLFRKKKDASEFKRVATLEQIPKDGTPVNVPVLADKVDAWTVEVGQPIGAVYLRREGEDGETVVCYNAVCPHAGCMVAYSGDQSKFLCPCHNSAFGLDGEKIDLPGKSNPSPRPMDTLEVDEEKVKKDGEVWIKFENFYPGKHDKVAKT